MIVCFISCSHVFVVMTDQFNTNYLMPNNCILMGLIIVQFLFVVVVVIWLCPDVSFARSMYCSVKHFIYQRWMHFPVRGMYVRSTQFLFIGFGFNFTEQNFWVQKEMILPNYRYVQSSAQDTCKSQPTRTAYKIHDSVVVINSRITVCLEFFPWN